MRYKVVIWGLFVFVTIISCNFVTFVPVGDKPATEIPPGSDPPTPPPQEGGEGTEPTPVASEPTATPTPGPPTPTPIPEPTRYFLQFASTCPPNAATDKNGNCCPYQYTQSAETGYCVPPEGVTPPPTPRHGLWIVLILPALVLGIPWLIAELNMVRYVQPKGLDLSTVRIKAKDGLFLNATVSLTARRTLSMASTRMTWGRVQEFVEKSLEQELIHEAIGYNSLEELEENMKDVSEKFIHLPVVKELSHDFGVEVMRFNVEIGYPRETMDALNRKAEASADGTAYLAYAAAAHLDPDSLESRELYRVYQETRGQVDAARNLGGGLTSIAAMFGQQKNNGESDDDSSNK